MAQRPPSKWRCGRLFARLPILQRLQISLRVRISGAQPQGFAEFGDGGIDLPGLAKRYSQTQVGGRVAGIELDRAPELSHGLFRFAMGLESAAEVVMRLRKVRIESDGALEMPVDGRRNGLGFSMTGRVASRVSGAAIPRGRAKR